MEICKALKVYVAGCVPWKNTKGQHSICACNHIFTSAYYESSRNALEEHAKANYTYDGDDI